MNISPEDAARALGEIEASRAAMRTAIRTTRGHYQLWLWGAIWVVMALLVEFRGMPGLRLCPWLCLAGIPVSLAIILSQHGRIHSPVDKRFLGVLATIVVFAVIYPFVLGYPHNSKADFAYSALVCMFCYIVAGIWFDVYLFWVGLLISALLLGSLLFFPAIFWWSVVLGGAALIGTGFYVRFFWR
jgi:hypothetical protein